MSNCERRELIMKAVAAVTLLDHELFDEVRPATQEESIEQGIDFHGGKDDYEACQQLGTSVAVIYQDSISLELEQHKGSSAQAYAVIVGANLHYITRSQIDSYIALKGWNSDNGPLAIDKMPSKVYPIRHNLLKAVAKLLTDTLNLI